MLVRMQAELLYFALSIVAGVLAAFLGSGIKWLHWRRRRAIWLGCLDLLYWLLFGLSLFLLCFYQNSGIFRGYAVAGTLLGYGLVWAGERVCRKNGNWRRPNRRIAKRNKQKARKEPEEKEPDRIKSGGKSKE
ncbi:MAG: spore cortex biosynthesis protein YabQ [Lachnospiraceae bacterium]|jgi:hypothetical protein|nr:spore cortex biosynthesis protein YabQ [Lachnospiraceae bacterium]